MRRYRFQMNQAETRVIEQFVRGLNVHSMLHHAVDRCREKNVNPRDAEKALLFGYAVEIHNDIPGDIRVVMRYTPQGNENSACVVVSLIRKCIITVWPNHRNDNHVTLRKNLYQWQQSAITTFIQLKS